MPFFSMVDRRKRMHLDMRETLPQQYPEILKTYIPYASDVEQMGIYRSPLGSYALNGVAGCAYQQLWEEVKAGL